MKEIFEAKTGANVFLVGTSTEKVKFADISLIQLREELYARPK